MHHHQSIYAQFYCSQIKPLHDAYQNEVSATLWEPLNTFWAECYEACKSSSQRRAIQLMESRRKFQVRPDQTKEFNACARVKNRITYFKIATWFVSVSPLHTCILSRSSTSAVIEMIYIIRLFSILQQRILMPWRIRQSEEVSRLNSLQAQRKMRDVQVERHWRNAKRFLHSSKGAFPLEWVTFYCDWIKQINNNCVEIGFEWPIFLKYFFFSNHFEYVRLNGSDSESRV